MPPTTNDEHPLVKTCGFANAREHCLYLMHLRAYEEAAGLVTGKRVLDLGCNNGYGAAIVAAVASEVIGLDTSAAAIAQAEASLDRPYLRFQVFDGEHIPFADGHFDVVISCQVIEHVTDVAAYLDEIGRVLKPDGMAIFTTPNACIRLDPGMTPWNRFHVMEFRPRELEQVLSRNFGDVTVQGVFAAPDLYAIEYGRCQAALAGARRRNGWRRLVRPLVPQWLRRLRVKPAALPGAPFQPRHTSSDFFYSTDKLETALDLMAVCRRPIRR